MPEPDEPLFYVRYHNLGGPNADKLGPFLDYNIAEKIVLALMQRPGVHNAFIEPTAHHEARDLRQALRERNQAALGFVGGVDASLASLRNVQEDLGGATMELTNEEESIHTWLAARVRADLKDHGYQLTDD